MEPRLLPLLLVLAWNPPAQAELRMRVFDGSGGNRDFVSVAAVEFIPAAAAAPEARPLEMAVFATQPGQATRRVALEGAAQPDSAPRRSAQSVPSAPSDPYVASRQSPPTYRLDLDGALRRDDLHWSIADTDGQPNVLSELSWRDQQSLMLSARGEVAWPSGWLLRAQAGAGTLYRGVVQDSDYGGDGRTQEWSRSVGDADDGGVLDLSLAAGRHFRLGGLALTPTLGYGFHEQNLRVNRVTQVVAEANTFGVTLPAVGTSFDAQSSYTARWHGPRLALDMDLNLAGGWALNLGGWYEWVDYKGVGNWALREEFEHPESFTHLASGRVRGWQASLSRPWGKSGRWRLSWEQVRGRTGAGDDVTHFENAGDLATGLNEVVWDSEIWKLGLEWTF